MRDLALLRVRLWLLQRRVALSLFFLIAASTLTIRHIFQGQSRVSNDVSDTGDSVAQSSKSLVNVRVTSVRLPLKVGCGKVSKILYSGDHDWEPMDAGKLSVLVQTPAGREFFQPVIVYINGFEHERYSDKETGNPRFTIETEPGDRVEIRCIKPIAWWHASEGGLDGELFMVMMLQPDPNAVSSLSIKGKGPTNSITGWSEVGIENSADVLANSFFHWKETELSNATDGLLPCRELASRIIVPLATEGKLAPPFDTVSREDFIDALTPAVDRLMKRSHPDLNMTLRELIDKTSESQSD